MFSVWFYQNFSFFLVIVLGRFSSCRVPQKSEAIRPAPTFCPEELKKRNPFATKEPGFPNRNCRLTAEERKNYVARMAQTGGLILMSARNQISVCRLIKNYLILPDKSIIGKSCWWKHFWYGRSDGFLTANGLYEKRSDFWTSWNRRQFDKISCSIKDGRFVGKYYLSLRNVGFPVGRNFIRSAAGQKILRYTVELEIELQADDDLFLIPKNFRRVTAAEFRKILRNLQE